MVVGPDYVGVVLVADIHHVSLNVSDVDRSLHFYRDVMRMSVLPRPDFPFRGAWLDAGNGRQIHLIESDVPDDLGQHVAFRVDDIEQAIDTLRSAGIDVPDARPVADSPIRQTFLLDPDGNRIELTQPAR